MYKHIDTKIHKDLATLNTYVGSSEKTRYVLGNITISDKYKKYVWNLEFKSLENEKNNKDYAIASVALSNKFNEKASKKQLSQAYIGSDEPIYIAWAGNTCNLIG